MDIKGLDISTSAVVQQVQARPQNPVSGESPGNHRPENTKPESNKPQNSRMLDRSGSKGAENDKAGSSGRTADRVNISKDKGSDKKADKARDIQKQTEATPSKAYFAVDDEAKQVVIRVVDAKGKLLEQIPPEEYLKMQEKMKVSSESLFHTKA